MENQLASTCYIGALLDSNLPLPALRIACLVNRTFGPAVPTSIYALVVNWDPQEPSFTLKDKSIKDGEYGKLCDSWTQAYQAALVTIMKIDKLYHRMALLRGLTPAPLQFLSAEVEEYDTECNGTGISARYGWQFLGSSTKRLDVEVVEKEGMFKGIHDNRNHHA